MIADTGNRPSRIYHISEEGGIKTFTPRPSPSQFNSINGDVVFGISGQLLHNYLFPRNCPRVTYYADTESSPADINKFICPPARYVIAIEAGWVPIIRHTTLYCYAFDAGAFTVLDACAGYYIAYTEVTPVAVRRIDDIFSELFNRNNVELRILPALWPLADAVTRSTLNYSLIRMRNAIPREQVKI